MKRRHENSLLHSRQGIQSVNRARAILAVQRARMMLASWAKLAPQANLQPEEARSEARLLGHKSDASLFLQSRADFRGLAKPCEEEEEEEGKEEEGEQPLLPNWLQASATFRDSANRRKEHPEEADNPERGSLRKVFAASGVMDSVEGVGTWAERVESMEKKGAAEFSVQSLAKNELYEEDGVETDEEPDANGSEDIDTKRNIALVGIQRRVVGCLVVLILAAVGIPYRHSLGMSLTAPAGSLPDNICGIHFHGDVPYLYAVGEDSELVDKLSFPTLVPSSVSKFHWSGYGSEMNLLPGRLCVQGVNVSMIVEEVCFDNSLARCVYAILLKIPELAIKRGECLLGMMHCH